MANRSIGKVSTAAASGGAIGAAFAQILVHLVPSLSPVEAAITVILTAGIALLGGYLVPPVPADEDSEESGEFSMEQIDEITTVTKYRPATGDRGNQDDPDGPKHLAE